MNFKPRQITALINEFISDGNMSDVWRAVQTELDADITIEYEGGPVQVRFGDFISGDFKRIPLKRIVSELVDAARSTPDEQAYYLEIASALESEAKRLRKATSTSTSTVRILKDRSDQS